jgi:F-type H+-transporting ATPase subunit delta
VAGNDIARVYATSLLEIGQDKNVLAQLEEELGFVSSLLKEDNEFSNYLTSPGFTKESKKEFIGKVFSDKLSDYIINFLYVLIEHGRQSVIPEINTAFNGLLDEANNRMRVDVVSTVKLESATLDKIIGELKKKYNKDIIVSEKIDEKILGGIIIEIGDLVIDGSLASNLKKIKYNLLNSKVRSDMAYED